MSNAFVVRMTISLDDVTPAVSRTIEVPLDIRLDRLHTIFQEALGWTDSHLWELTFGRTGFGIPDPSYGLGGPLDARKTTLAEALEGMRGKTFQYLYDFGDGWEHSVKIQGIAPADPQGTYPRLLEATGMRPPEDSGGPYAFGEGRGSGGFALIFGCAPIPWQQFVETVLGDVGDAAEHIGKPCLRIDVVELRRANEAQHEGGALAAAI